MNDLKFIRTDGEPSVDDKKALVEGLLAHHAKSGHPRKTDVFSLFIHKHEDKPVAGIIVSFLWDGMHIDSLWVEESVRGNGLGKKLMEEAENEGRKRGCKVSYTDTFTWQAPEFYKKLGYTLYGELTDFPKGSSLFYVQKRL